MKRSELERKLADKFDLQLSRAEQIVDTIIEHASQMLKKGKRIEIRGFGSFFTKSYRSYKGRNPKTGRIVDVPPKRLPNFKPSKKLKKILNKEG